jgi:hypothetical protein
MMRQYETAKWYLAWPATAQQAQAVIAQGGGCGICGCRFPRGGLHVYHDRYALKKQRRKGIPFGRASFPLAKAASYDAASCAWRARHQPDCYDLSP